VSNFDPAFYTALTTLINATWTDLASAGGIYRMSQINRANFESQMTTGGPVEIARPYAIVDVAERRPTDQYGMASTSFFYPTDIYRIITTEGETDVSATMTASLADLRSALISSSSTGFQCMHEHPRIDVSPFHPVNRILFDLDTGLFAGRLQVDLLVGEVP